MKDIFLEFDIHNKEAEHELESAFDKFVINIKELVIQEKQGLIPKYADRDAMLITEAKNLKGAVSKFYKTLRVNLALLMKKARDKKKEHFNDAKNTDLLRKLRNKIQSGEIRSDKKFDFYDDDKLNKAYAEYTKYCMDGLKKLLPSNFESDKEFNEAYDKYCEDCEKKAKELHIDDIKTYTVEIDLKGSMDYLDKTIIGDKSQMTFWTAWDDTIKTCEDLASKENDANKISSINDTSRVINTQSTQIYKELQSISTPLENELMRLLKEIEKEIEEEENAKNKPASGEDKEDSSKSE